MEVTDVLRDRTREPEGLRKMVALSMTLHGVLIAAALFAPRGSLSRPPTLVEKVMTITLGGGGGEGPRNGGMTAMGGRPVQTVTPPDAPRAAIRPPAPSTSEMTVPAPNAPVMTVPAPKATMVKSTPAVTQAPEEARGRTPTSGAQVSAGSALAETGARGQGWGLSTGGGAGSGSTIDAADFCCPDYLVQMIDRIRTNWIRQAETAGTNVVKFTIQRDGRIADVVLEKSSGFQNLDLSSQRALLMTKTLNPLPAEFPNPTLTVHLNFQYQR